MACCIFTSAGCVAGVPRSCVLSSPHDHCTVPAPNTSAPLACRYMREVVRGASNSDGHADVVHDALRRRSPSSRTAASAPRAWSRCRRPRPIRIPGCRRRASRHRRAAGRRRPRCRATGAACPSLSGTWIALVPLLTVQRVPVSAFSGLPPSAGGAQALVAPGAGPHGQSIDLRRRQTFLVAHERAVRRARPLDAVLPAGLPEHLVAAQERQIDTGSTRGLDVGALRVRPVFVVADREENLRTIRSADDGRCRLARTDRYRHRPST